MTPAQLKELRIYRDGQSLRMGGWRSPANGRVAAALARMGYLERLDQSENVRGEGRAYWSEYRPVEAKLPEIQRLTEHIVMWEREAYYAKYPDAPRVNAARRPFGAETADAKRAIERKLVAEGAVPGSPELHFAVDREWVEQNRGKPTLRERQEAARARGEKWVATAPDKATHLRLTEVEAEYLREKLAGVNDPVGAAVLAKLTS